MIWLIGCNGMLGQEVARQLNENKLHWVGTDKEVDITNPDALEDFERKNETSSYEISNLSHSDRQIKWIINCSAYTNVEKAEEDVELAEKIKEEIGFKDIVYSYIGTIIGSHTGPGTFVLFFMGKERK